MNDKRYRKNVGLIVLNENNQLLICKRKDKSAWQFPQGGIDAGEKNLDAAYRELFEEVGIAKHQVKVISRSKHWYHYDILFIPWINQENSARTYKMIKESKAKVAMGHLELNGFVATHGHTMEHGADFECYDKFKQVFSGHYHTRSNNGRIYYLGNPYEMFWNDVNDKRGFHIYDTETLKLKTVDNPNQLYKIINYNDTPRQLFKFSEYSGKIVKVIVRQKTSEKEYDMFMDALFNTNPVDVKVIERTDDIIFGGDIVNQTEDTMTLLDNYVDDLETDLNKSRIKGLIKEIYQEACEVT